jgi:hypothetical protein
VITQVDRIRTNFYAFLARRQELLQMLGLQIVAILYTVLKYYLVIRPHV